MAKRKEPVEATEPTRRSSRTAVTEKPAPAPKPAPKKKAPTSKKVEAPVEEETAPEPAPEEEPVVEKPVEEEKKEPEPEAEAEEGEPEAKKAKTASVTDVGSVVEDVTLKNEDGEDVSLASIYEKSGVVIFSYPKANTPGCTTQACGFRDSYEEIQKTGYTVLGLSADPPKSQLSWKTKQNFQYHLLSDPSKVLLKALGWTEAKKRNHWVIEKGGKLLEAKLNVKPADSPKDALAFIKAL